MLVSTYSTYTVLFDPFELGSDPGVPAALAYHEAASWYRTEIPWCISTLLSPSIQDIDHLEESPFH